MKPVWFADAVELWRVLGTRSTAGQTLVKPPTLHARHLLAVQEDCIAFDACGQRAHGEHVPLTLLDLQGVMHTGALARVVHACGRGARRSDHAVPRWLCGPLGEKEVSLRLANNYLQVARVIPHSVEVVDHACVGKR